MGELSRVEDLLETGTEDTVNPLSRVEAILRGEDIKPLSRIEALLEEHSGGGKGGGTYNTDEDKIKNDAFMLHKDTNFIFTDSNDCEILYNWWDYTESFIDKVEKIPPVTGSDYGGECPTRDSEGIHITTPDTWISFTKDHQNIYTENKVVIIEIETGEMERRFIASNGPKMFISWTDNDALAYNPANDLWGTYGSNAWWYGARGEITGADAFNNCNVKIVHDNTSIKIYRNDSMVLDLGDWTMPTRIMRKFGSKSYAFYDMTIKSVKVYTPKNYKRPAYCWWTNPDETLIIRKKLSDGSFRWYFNGYEVKNYYSPFDSVPTNLKSFIKNNTGCRVSEVIPTGIFADQEYYEKGVIGFYGNTIRLWTENLGQNFTGKIKGIIDSTDSTISYNNYHEWEEPTFDYYNG